MKRRGYERIPSLRTYLLVESAWRGVHRHWRTEDGSWRTELVTGDEGAIPLPCPAGVMLTLAEVYERLTLPSDPPPGTRLRRVKEGAPGAYASAGPD